MVPFERWLAALEARHLADLTFAEIARALRALSATYVERRHRLVSGGALEGAGKRAAFALFYGPLHYLIVREIVRALPDARAGPRTLVDLGCGTGASGAAWALESTTSVEVIGIDRHPWPLAESAWTYRELEIRSHIRRADLAAARIPRGPARLLAAFTLNELAEPAREQVFLNLLHRSTRGDQLLIVEPLAGFVAPGWPAWRDAIQAAGGRADEWRFEMELPPIIAKLDRAAGLDHRELTARSLWLAR